ncbi:MAG: rare lipoprotein A [Octadecabacter sp.]
MIDKKSPQNAHSRKICVRTKGRKMGRYFLSKILILKNNFGITSALILVATLGACGIDGEYTFPTLVNDFYDVSTAAPSQSVQLVKRDVEAPNVFQVTEAGLWDGRLSLGGVWVAHPDVTEPERVIIRNQTNDTFVIGTLFRRERNNPDQSLQVSSDAAATLELLAGSPTQLQVTALRPEEFSDAPQATPIADFEALTDIAAALPVSSPRPANPPPAPGLRRAFIQVGIFSIENNARGTADRLRSAGIVPTVLKQTSQDRTFWRVIIGPTTSENERSELLSQVKSQGFEDAYFVTN